MTYPLLEKAPPADSPDFIPFLKQENKVIWENDQWLVIENCKYHSVESPWWTAFHKFEWKNPGKVHARGWWNDVKSLYWEFGEFEWRKKSADKQTVPKRFHIHITPSTDQVSQRMTMEKDRPAPVEPFPHTPPSPS